MNVSNINSFNNKTSVYGIYNSMYQGNMALNNIKLNRSYYYTNKAEESRMLGGDALKYVGGIKSASKNLSNDLRDLSASAFANKTAVSSDKETMSVEYNGKWPSSIKPTTVKVDQTAAGQVNEGTKMAADANYGSSGENKFTINIDGKTTELTVNVAAGDTNSAVQQKMADAVNNANLGVKATVQNDSLANQSTLKLEANATGVNDKSKFTIADTTGDLVAKTGADQMSSDARNALFSVNGGPQNTSQTNTVNIGSGLNVTFNKASDKEVTISAGQDMAYIKTAVEGLVKSYNDLFSEAAQRTSDPKAQNLATKMINTSKTYSQSLSSIGVGFDNEGKMTLDETRFNQALESGRVERFFTENSGKNYGFTNRMSRLADDVSTNTSSYVGRAEFGNNLTENFSYSNTGNLLQYSYFSTGWMFDYSS